MKKLMRSYLAIWAVLLVLFNVIAFVSVGWSGQEKYTSSFWIGYVSITIAFLGQLLCTYYALKNDSPKKSFFSLSLVAIGRTGLFLTFVFGGLCMLISPLPYWVGTILCAVVLAFNAIAVLKTDTAADLVETVDEKVKVQTSFVRLLTVDAENLLSCAKTDRAKAVCKKVYDAIRYSDPMSNDALATIESQISLKFAELSEAVNTNDSEKVLETANEVIILIRNRNKRCELLK